MDYTPTRWPQSPRHCDAMHSSSSSIKWPEPPRIVRPSGLVFFATLTGSYKGYQVRDQRDHADATTLSHLLPACSSLWVGRCWRVLAVDGPARHAHRGRRRGHNGRVLYASSPPPPRDSRSTPLCTSPGGRHPRDRIVRWGRHLNPLHNVRHRATVSPQARGWPRRSQTGWRSRQRGASCGCSTWPTFCTALPSRCR